MLNSAIRDESKYENNNYTLNLNEILQNVSKIDMIYATLTNSMKLFDDYTNILEYEYEGPAIGEVLGRLYWGFIWFCVVVTILRIIFG